ncbi:class I SAM-dependent methyltransferase [Polymorphospora lycopeni]|uniref:Class I SAM-dependent methyltransferase n=1 Tax=Polymorphospora lycopeni TaxID=3140240 RepID=A0ABV5CKE3_9ACTN
MGVAGEIQATALVAAACRAEETRQPAPRLTDPYAERFLDSLDAAGRALLAAGRDEVVHRTTLIDGLLLDEVRRHPGATVVNLGAGLCTRPYRLDLSACREYVEVDAPEILARKATVLGGAEPSCPVRRIPGDVRGLPALGVDGPAVLVTEGLLVYLPPAELAGLAATLGGLPAVTGWLADVVSADSARAMAAVAGRARAGLALHGLESMDTVERAGWAVADYRLLPARRPAARPTGRPPGPSVPASRRVLDGVVLLRPAAPPRTVTGQAVS